MSNIHRLNDPVPGNQNRNYSSFNFENNNDLSIPFFSNEPSTIFLSVFNI